MDAMRYRGIAVSVIVLALLLLALYAMPVMAEYNTDCYHAQGGNTWVCDNGGKIELQTGATLDVQNGATLDVQNGATLDVQNGATATFGGFITLGAQDTISVTMNGTITPTGTYQPLESAGTVNTASVAAGDEGDLLILTNTANTSIVLTDTGTLKLTGNITLGQFDSITLISDGTNWVELSRSDN